METIWQISSVLSFPGRDKERKTAREKNGGEIYESRRHHRLWCLLWDRIEDVLFALGNKVWDLDWYITGSCATGSDPSSSQLPPPAWEGTTTAPSRLIPGKGMQVRWKGRHNNMLGEGNMILIKIIKGLQMKNKSTLCHKVLLPPQHLLFGVHT